MTIIMNIIIVVGALSFGITLTTIPTVLMIDGPRPFALLPLGPGRECFQRRGRERRARERFQRGDASESSGSFREVFERFL